MLMSIFKNCKEFAIMPNN